MEAAWLAAVIILPLFFNVYSSRIFEPDKITLLRSLALLTLGAWFVKVVEEGSFRIGKLEPGQSVVKVFFSTPMLFPVLFLIFSYLISTIFSVTPRTSFLGSYQRLQGTYTTFSYLIIFAALLINLRKRRQVERLLTTIILASIPVALYGFLQRYQLDPIPWGGNVSVRVASNMGNSIFVAAYLIMVFPLTVGRIVEASDLILKDAPNTALNITKATIYMFVAGIQVFALYMTQSRGPMLGWLASLFFIILLLSLRWRKRWITFSVITTALAIAGFLLILNVKNGPLESLKQSTLLGRFGRILDSESNNALVRKYIWEGAAKLVAPHAPIEYPDGSLDKYNFLRPLIGYGPESMYVAFNPFYPPLLGQVEKRNASPDRSHNETWDSLVITGLLGFIAYLLVFLSIFYYGLKWLGLIHGKNQRIFFYICIFGGGIVGAILLILWGGTEFFGVGLPFGIAVGMILYFVYIAIFGGYEIPQNPGEAARALTLIILIAAVLAHFLEINFGIAIGVTRTYFWVYSALIILVGKGLPARGEYGSLDSPTNENDRISKSGLIKPSQKASRTKRRKAERSGKPWQSSEKGWIYNSILAGLLLALILVSLNFDYVSNPGNTTSTISIFWSSLTRLSTQGGALSYGILALFSTTWLFSALIYSAELPEVGDQKMWLKAFGIVLAVSAGIGLINGLMQAHSLSNLAKFSPTNDVELLSKVSQIGGLLTQFYIWVFLIVFTIGFVLFLERYDQAFQPVRWGWVFAPLWLILVIWGSFSTNLKVIQADIAYKMADPFASSNQWLVATLLYNRALDLAPNEDYYYLFLGRSYLEYAKTLQDDAGRQDLVERAKRDLQEAQKINPLNTDHTANLARLYSWWASKTDDPATKEERGQISSDYYARATTLSPNNSTLWGEWAILLMDTLDQPEAARQKLEHALELDPAYSLTLGLMGDYYAQLAHSQADESQKEAYLNQAIDYYLQAVKVAKSTENTNKIGYLVSLGNIYVELASKDPEKLDPGLILKAVASYQEAIDAQPSAKDLYRIENQIARLYVQLSDKANALVHAEAALEAAPEDQKESLTAFIEQIQAMP
jgi:O-antigen ligase